MKTIKRLVAFVTVLGLGVIAFLSFYKGETSVLQASTQLSEEELIKRGEYLAYAGDCMACHTNTADKPYAGGHGIESPIGTIYVTNITPDKEHGIGKWSLQDFDNAMRYGLRKNGDALYPAMPFAAFSRLTDEDIEALYTYLMKGVEPIAEANRKNDIPWPLSLRFPLNGWRLAFAPKPEVFNFGAYEDATVARGAYLVQGLGHCGSCHTPRTLTLNEKAYSEFDHNGELFLSGGHAPIEGWVATSLRGENLTGLGRTSEEQLFQFLKTGRNDTSAAFGGMRDVIVHSLQHLTDEDLQAMARYLKTLPSFADEEDYRYDDTVAKALFNGDDSMRGGDVYLDNCAACHRTDGKGYARTFPALAGNTTLQAKDPASAINIVLKGHRLDGILGDPTYYTMPNLDWRLSDQDIADVVTFIRTSWGNSGDEVSVSLVKKYRDAL